MDIVNFDVARIGFLVSTFTFLIVVKFYLFFRSYDILYTREALTGLFFRYFIFEFHALPEKMSRIYKYLLRCAGRLIVLTSFTKANLVELGFDARKISVMPDAVDIKEFDLDISREATRKKLGLPFDKKIR